MLSSLGASAAALNILGEVEEAEWFLVVYRWDPTFETLNKEQLEYRKTGRWAGFCSRSVNSSPGCSMTHDANAGIHWFRPGVILASHKRAWQACTLLSFSMV